MSKELRISIAAYRPDSAVRAEGPNFDLQRNMREAGAMVELAAQEGADIVVLPETFALQGSGDWTQHAEPLTGYVVSTLSGLARKYKIGIAAGHALTIENVKHNSMFLLDRDGDMIALYHKAFPTIWEMERGVIPGEGAAVHDTPFGRIGFAICYDLNFAELRLAYRDLRPSLILFGSAFRGGLQTRWWAYETRSYVVSSVIDPKSMIVNPVGRVLGETDVWSRSLTETINLDFAVLHLDYSNRVLAEVRRRHGSRLDVESAEAEGVLLIANRGDGLIQDILTEHGLSEVEDYMKRSRDARQAVLDGRPLTAGPPPW